MLSRINSSALIHVYRLPSSSSSSILSTSSRYSQINLNYFHQNAISENKNTTSSSNDSTTSGTRKSVRMCFLGAPGVGKGTFANRAAPHFGIPAISSGDLVREQIKKKTAIGNMIKNLNDRGNLISDEIMIEMIVNRLGQTDAKQGYILDGFPRRVSQAEALSRFSTLDLAVNIVLREDVLVEKAISRRVCNSCGTGYNIANIQREDIQMPPLLPKVEGKCDNCQKGVLIQRADDQEAIVRKRLEVYHEESKPVVAYYAKVGVLVDFPVKRGLADLPRLLEVIKSKINNSAPINRGVNPTYTH